MSETVISVVVDAKATGTRQISDVTSALNSLSVAAAKTSVEIKKSKGFTDEWLNRMSSLVVTMQGATMAINQLADGYEKFNTSMRAVNTMAGKDSADFEKLTSHVHLQRGQASCWTIMCNLIASE